MTIHEAERITWLAAMAADDAFQAELVRVYGKRAGDARYLQTLDHEDERVRNAAIAKVRADADWYFALETRNDC